jgi:predicted dehydrogenase
MNTSTKTISRAVTRRRFLQHAAFGAAAGYGAPAIVPSSVLGAFTPNNRINVAEIGTGNQSQVDLPAFLQQPDAQVVAVCDVNTASHGYSKPEQFLGRKPGQERVNAYYAKKTGVGQYKGCDAYIDFREVLARADVDAVVLVVPDHWHAIMTVMAAKAGKDIYCEKPLSLTVRDGQEMVKAVRKYKRVLQTGSMYRSGPRTRFACELVRNGRIGKLTRILTSVGGAPKGPGPGWKPMPVPEGFDYGMWLGPAPAAPYHIDRCLYRFRYILDYSGGETTNTGAHVFGQIQWALGTDDTGPVEFEDALTQWPEPGDLYTAATRVRFRARYANGAELLCGVNVPGVRVAGTRFEGTEGWLDLGWDGLETHPDSLKATKFGPNEIRLPLSVAGREMLLSGRQQMKGSGLNVDHARNFLDCVRSRQDPVEPVEAGHRTASLCHLANIAMRLRRKIRWDPHTEQIVNDEEADKMLSRPIRAPWTL